MTEPAALSENDIYERLVATILDRRLPPGAKLAEDRLASALGVSRTRIRPVLVRPGGRREAARLMTQPLQQLESQLMFSEAVEEAPDLMALFGAVNA